MKILSEGKFREFDGVISQGIKSIYKIYFDSGKYIEATSDHRFLSPEGEWIYVSDLEIGDVLDNGSKVTKILKDHELKEVYDAYNVEGTHSYWSDGVTSHNCSFLYIDEAGFVENWDEFFTSVFPTISSGTTTKILLTSTPNGLNHFYKICSNAQKEGVEWNGYAYHEVPWWKIPGRDENWRKETLAGMDFDTEKFAQEYECAWLGSSGTLISGWKLKELVHSEPLNQKNGLFVYKQVEKDHVYAMVVDVSRGKGLDYSAFQIIDVTKMPYTQVASYRNNLITPIDYTSVIYKLAKAYNNSMVLVEINDIGGQVSDLLYYDFEYENVIFTESAGRSGKRVSGGFGQNVDRGIRTTKSVKAVGCSLLKLLIEGNQLIINDMNTIKELSRFSKKGSSYEAESGSTDDLVMGLVLFSWLSDQQYFREMTDINTLHMLREKTDEALEEELLPFGFVNNGLDEDYAQAAADFWKEDKVKRSIDDLYSDDTITNY